MKQHYHVFVGLRGYMPAAHEITTSRRAAEQSAAWWAWQFREAGDRVTGSAKHGYDVNDDEYIEVVPCQDDCL